MRHDIDKWLVDYAPQRSDEWLLERLGHFTGSKVGRLMKAGKGGELFGKDALSYIEEIAGDRLVNDAALDDYESREDFINSEKVTNRNIEWGIKTEPKAIYVYEGVMGVKVTPCGSIAHDSVEFFRDSPDGLLLEHDGVLEIKCPQRKNHAHYLLHVTDAKSLELVEPLYYWQCIAHMAVTGASFCDWMSFHPYGNPSVCHIRIKRDDNEINRLLERINKAEEICKEFTMKAKLRKMKLLPKRSIVIVN